MLWHLARQVRRGPTLVVLDELTWLGSKDPAFLGKLKTAWDLEFRENPELVLIYACELKFSQEPLGPSVVPEMQRRISSLQMPRGFSVRPILVHVNGVRDAVVESEYFARIIDLSSSLALF